MKKIALSILSVIDPLPFIVISFWRLPDSESIFFAVLPLSIEYLPIYPHKFSFSMPFSPKIFSSIRSISILFAAHHFNVLFIFSFINFLFRDCNSMTMSLFIDYLSEIHPIFRRNDVKVVLLY